jgi:hypothetical protein
MKETRSLLNSLVACGVALAMVSTLAAQTINQGAAKVARLKGGARYKAGSNDWQPLKVGDIVKPGTVIQTAANSRVDLVLGDGSAPVARPVAGEALSYQPSAEQNMVRMWENSLLGIDKLTVMETGADVVTETQLDLKAGHIFGMVKKMSAASKYEVKIPNGVAGIRGTTYDASAEGVIKVLSGSVVLAYVGPDGTVVTQVIMSLQQFDARTGVLSPLAGLDRTGMDRLIRQLPAGITPMPTLFTPDKTLNFISPH